MANNIFKTIKVNRPKRNTFNLSHTNSLTGAFGNLIPFLCEETVPGDTWKVSAKTNTIFAPLSCPCLTNMFATVHYFFVPYRLLNADFEEFITNGDGVRTPPAEPRIELPCSGSLVGNQFADRHKYFVHGSLADYLGYPTSPEVGPAAGGIPVSVYPFRAYQRIYDEYYRDENQIPQDELALKTTSGNVIAYDSPEYKAVTKLRKRAWAKDYFTSALPWTQKGPQQGVPLLGNGQLASDQISFINNGTTKVVNTANNARYTMGIMPAPSGGDLSTIEGGTVSSSVNEARVDNTAQLKLSNKKVDVDGLSFTINDFRRANAIQRWFERNARAGSRYVESLLAHFGVISSDARIQRPEFLGGNTTKISVSDVIQTSASDNVTPQGNRSGLAYSFQSAGFTRTFEERGLIIGIFSVMPQGTYSEGLRKTLYKKDVFDYYFPEFAHLGEQEIAATEVALRGSAQELNSPFGYAPRYAEYKFIPSTIHGDFKNINGLGDWTLARHYATQPTLSKEFIEVDAENQDLDRIFAVQAESSYDQIMVNFDISVKARRPIPYLPEPSL